MTAIYLSDQDRILKMTTGRLPDQDKPVRVLARSPIDFKEHEYTFTGRDEACAWNLAATAQRTAAYHGYNPASLGIEAYVLRSNGNRGCSGLFGPCYFWHDSPDTTARLTILKVNRRVQEDPIEYGLMEKLQRLDPAAHAPMPDDLISSGRLFLDDLLKAYQAAEQTQEDPVLEVMARAGHPHIYSNGFHDIYPPDGPAQGPGYNGDGSGGTSGGGAGNTSGHLSDRGWPS